MLKFFFISLLVLDFRKSVWSVPSISVAVLVSIHKKKSYRSIVLICAQNIANFVSLPRKLDNPNYHSQRI